MLLVQQRVFDQKAFDQKVFDRRKYQDTLNSGFLMSVYEHDFASARRFLQEGADINCRGRRGETALAWSARLGLTAQALLLLDLKAQPNIQDAQGNTALFHAVQRGDLTLAKALIAQDADITLENKDGDQALTLAFKLACPAMVELFEKPLRHLLMRIPLPRQAAAAESTDPHGDTMLTWAARNGQDSVVRALLRSGTNPAVRNRDGETAYDIARKAGHGAICDILRAAHPA